MTNLKTRSRSCWADHTHRPARTAKTAGAGTICASLRNASPVAITSSRRARKRRNTSTIAYASPGPSANSLTGAREEVFRLSQGVPRLINVICDRALLGASGSESRRVSRRMVQRAAAEIAGRSWALPWQRWFTPLATAAGLGLIAFGAWSVYEQRRDDGAAAAVEVAAATTVAEPVSPPVPASDPPAGSAAVAVEDLVAAGPSLEQELVLANDLTDASTALASLFSTSGACRRARRREPVRPRPQRDNECVVQRGSWNSLRQYDRPAILTLTDSQGESHQVVLAEVQGEQARLSIGGVDVEHHRRGLRALVRAVSHRMEARERLFRRSRSGLDWRQRRVAAPEPGGHRRALSGGATDVAQLRRGSRGTCACVPAGQSPRRRRPAGRRRRSSSIR